MWNLQEEAKTDVLPQDLRAHESVFSARIARWLLVYTKNLQKDQDILCLPVYLLPFLRETLMGRRENECGTKKRT